MANDDIREILCAALLSEEAFTITTLTDTEASDLSYVLVKALAAQGAPPAETCAWMWTGGGYVRGCDPDGVDVEADGELNFNYYRFCHHCGKRIEEADDD